jgi:hypothetical protein
MTCPTNTPTRLDLRNTSSCVEALQSMAQAYYTILTGNQRVMVRFQERWTEYQKGNVKELVNAYTTLYNQCPGAAAAGLPNLNPGLASRRGAPARGLNIFPRL